MTDPIVHGYPDFGRYQAQADKVFVDVNDPDIDAQETYGPFFVGDVPAFGIFFSVSTGSFRVFIDYADSILFTVTTDSHRIELRPGDTASLQLPTLGPWVRVRVDPQAANQAFLMTLWAASLPFRPNGGLADANRLYSSNAQNVPVGVTNLDVSRIWPGEAILYTRLPVATIDVRLKATFASGSTILLAGMPLAVGDAERRVFLPPMHLFIELNNTSGAVQTILISLTANPWSG